MAEKRVVILSSFFYKNNKTARFVTVLLNQILRLYNKSVKAWLFRVTLDLSVLASGLVAKNRTLGLRPRVLFLPTRPQARTDKSDDTLGPML